MSKDNLDRLIEEEKGVFDRLAGPSSDTVSVNRDDLEKVLDWLGAGAIGDPVMSARVAGLRAAALAAIDKEGEQDAPENR
jgi:hypothetical protein